MLHSAYASTIQRNRQSVPFMDLVEVCGLKLTGVETCTVGHCRLLVKFVETLTLSKAFLVGQYNTRSAKIIINGIKAVSSELDIDFLEGLLEAVINLDPGLLMMVMELLWQNWTKNNLLNIMSKLAAYLGKKSQPSSIMKDLYGQGRQLSKNKDFNPATLIRPFEALLLPLLAGMKIDFIGQLIIDLNITLTEGNAKNKQLIIDVIFIAIKVTLDSIHFESANLSDNDESRFFEQLDEISGLFEKCPTLPIPCIMSWWRLERQTRLFESKTNNQFMTELLCARLDAKGATITDAQRWLVELQRAHWACVTGFEIEDTAKDFCAYLSTLPDTVQIEDSSLLIEIAPDLYDVQPELLTGACMSMLSSPRHASLATLLLEDNQDLMYDVLCSKNIFEREFQLPITFLNGDKLDAILDALPFKDQASLSIIYELLYSTVRSKVCEKMDKKFYKLLSKVECTSENKLILRKVSQTICDKISKTDADKINAELTQWSNLKPHLLLAWMNCAQGQFDKSNSFNAQLPPIAIEIIKSRVSQNRFDSAGIQAVNILHNCVSRGHKLETPEIIEEAIPILVLQLEMNDEKYNGTAIRRCLEMINGQNQALIMLHKSQVNSLHSYIWPVLDKKRMIMRLKALKSKTNITSELITCCDLVAKFKTDTDEEKLVMKGFIEDIFSVLMSSTDLLMQLQVAQRLLMGNIKLANKFVRIILAFPVGRKINKDETIALIELLNTIVKSDSHSLVPLSGAFALTIKTVLIQILSEHEFGNVSKCLTALKRLVQFIQIRQIFISMGNCLPELIKMHTKFPNDGITESIMMILLDHLSERHIECFRSILAEHQKPVLASLYGTYRMTRKRKLQTV